jgi:membrane fusion protein (multidrug efflux system)
MKMNGSGSSLLIRRSIFLAVVLPVPLAVLLFSGCKEETPPPPAPPTVEVFSVEQRDVPIYGEAVGTVQANVNATISAQVTGYLLSRNYVEGTMVTSNQVLFQIDDRIYKAELDKAEARVVKTKMDVDRYTPLAKTQAISQQELDDAIQANIAAAAAADQARLNYEFCKITSPVNGVAGLALAQVGDLVGPNTGELTTVTTVDPMRVYFSVSQQLMTQIMEERLAEGREQLNATNGAPLELTLATGTVYPQQGQVRFKNNQVDVKTGTVRMVGEFPNPNQILIPGMFVRVRARIGMLKDALVVPQRAVAELQGRTLIAVVGADNKVSIKPVTTGALDGEMWVISGPFKPGDKVVAEGIQKVRDGVTVNPVPFGTAPKETPATAETPEKKS